MCIVKVYTADYALLPEDDFQHIRTNRDNWFHISITNKQNFKKVWLLESCIISSLFFSVWRNIFLIISIHFGTCTPFQAFLRLFVPYFITLHTILLYCALVNNSVHWCEYSNGNKTQLSIWIPHFPYKRNGSGGFSLVAHQNRQAINSAKFSPYFFAKSYQIEEELLVIVV